MRKADNEDLYATALQAARRAGRFLKKNAGTDFEVAKKGRINLVTEMDLQAEKIIVDQILEDFPDHEILAEERGSGDTRGAIKWIIDPLDGTTNYTHGYRFYCVSIAVEGNGSIQVGVVYDPVTEECFSARRGQGAWLNDKPIRVSSRSSLSDSLLATGFSYELEKIRENLACFNRLILEARGIRRDGSAALDLCYVACGRFDGFWELSLSPWDVAAGMLIVEEAGGRVSNFAGGACSVYDAEVLASNGRVHESMSRILKDRGRFRQSFAPGTEPSTKIGGFDQSKAED